MPDLLDDAIAAHGGMDRWREIATIDLLFNYSGALLEMKGFPRHLQPICSVDVPGCRVVFQRLGDDPDERWIFTADRCWIERRDGSVIAEREHPRAAFTGDVWTMKWDALHLTYFIGYAIWNYLTVPFLFKRTGFVTRELDRHWEAGEEWRVLEVTYPDDIPYHTKVQRLYFGPDLLIRRLDYSTDVLGGVAAHYCFDLRSYGDIVFPTLRRIVSRTPEGIKTFGRTGFLLDYIDLRVRP